MTKNSKVAHLLTEVGRWAPKQADILAIALVGSYARNAASDDSDVDIMMVVLQPSKYLNNRKWLEQFGAIEREQLEDYGKIKSIRIWYDNALEVEFGISDHMWLQEPLDDGTLQVIRKGMLIIFERTPILSRVQSNL